MSSKTVRFCHFALLLALLATGFGCGSGGGGGNGGGTTKGQDNTPPHFAGLNKVSVDPTGNVILNSPEATDDQTPGPQLTYLIYVANSPDAIQKNGTTPYNFTGANACSNGQCTFTITDLKKDGNTTYYFGSNAKDAAGLLDQDPHPDEAALKATPLAVTTGGFSASSSLNVNPTLDATHPALAAVGDQQYVIWEECTHTTSTTPDPTDPTKQISTPGWSDDHPCSQDTPSKIYVKRGANWDLLNGPSGQPELNDSSKASQNPTIAFDGTNLYAAWLERPVNTVVLKFNGSAWSNTGFPDPGADRPALTLHPALGSALGMAYEFSPTNIDHSQIFFRQFNGSWQPRSTPLNKDPNKTAEAPSFSKKGNQLYITWKEIAQTIQVPNPTPQNPSQTTPVSIPNVFVKQWNGTDWVPVGGGPLNINPANESRFPSIDVLGNVPYVAWHECLDASCGSEHIFVKHWDGSQWVQDKDTGKCSNDPNCGSLNVNSRFGKTPSLAVHNNKVYVAWSELDFNSNKFVVHLKHLDGTTWVPVDLPNTLFTNNAQSPMLYSNGALHLAWVEQNAQGILQLIVAKLG